MAATENLLNDPVGIGWESPLRFASGRVVLTSSQKATISSDDGLGDENFGSVSVIAASQDSQKRTIRQAIRRRVNTREGSRFMNGDFGSRVDLVVFEPNEPVSHALALFYAEIALLQDPRYVILSAQMAQDPNQVEVMQGLITYKILNTEVRDTSIVFEREVDQA